MSAVRFVPMEVTPQGAAPCGESDLLRLVELAGRTAYKSEDRITESSARAFVLMLKKHEHLSVLEHSNIVLKIGKTGTSPVHEFDLEAVSTAIVKALGPRNGFHRLFQTPGPTPDGFAMSGNLRSWIETLRSLDLQKISCRAFLARHLHRFFPSLFEDPVVSDAEWPIEVSLMSEAEQLELLRKYPESDLPLFVFKIVCDRGITHELVRHRVFSFTQESTRYVNYKNRGMILILPEELQPFHDAQGERLTGESPTVAEWHRRAEALFEWYRGDVERGLKPEIARDILPNLLKSEIFVSGRWSGWEHFIRLRDSRHAHPRIRFIAREVRKYFESIDLKIEDTRD
ncbi:MAG: FAD-dependent thymidylate synthase [Syntrophobacteraceae bacterium]|nr:FAD-dependent thymidylate synthase [Syntrophobacteraceae bacterium]